MTATTSAQNTSAYEVGYGKPPRHAQFRKGQSGNPGGRPRRSPAERANAMLLAEAFRAVAIRENDVMVPVPALQAIVRSQGAARHPQSRPAHRNPGVYRNPGVSWDLPGGGQRRSRWRRGERQSGRSRRGPRRAVAPPNTGAGRFAWRQAACRHGKTFNQRRASRLQPKQKPAREFRIQKFPS
jgi:hypothetical protein